MIEEKQAVELPEKLLKANEVAEILNISRALAYKLMNQGEIVTVKIGTARRVRPQDLQAYIETNLTTPLAV